MGSIIRPTSAQMTRRIVVLVCALFAVLTPQVQLLLGWGQSPAEFAADSDATMKVAGFAFSIWAVIYIGLLIYAVRQALPGTGESDLLNRLGWPSAIAFAGIGLWVIAAAFDWEDATIVLIFASLAVLLAPLLINAHLIRALPRADFERITVVWPLTLLAGWLSIAAPINLITVATGNGALPASANPGMWAIAAIGAVTLAALVVTWILRMPAYALPIAWGLLGVFVAEMERHVVLGGIALAASAVILVGSIALTFRLRPKVEKLIP